MLILEKLVHLWVSAGDGLQGKPRPRETEACLGADGQYLVGREAGPSLEEALEFQKESHSFST